MVEVDSTNVILNYVGILMSAILPVAVVWYFKNTERRRVDKELKIAVDLKSHTDRTANDLKLASVEIARDLRTHLDEKIKNIDDKVYNLDKSIADLSEQIKMLHNTQSELTKRVDIISVKQVESHKDQLGLISDLRHRADLTNGNIRNIRNDLMDIQESVEDITDNYGTETGEPSEKRQRDRRTKRRRIVDDAADQDSSKHDIGNDHTSRDY